MTRTPLALGVSASPSPQSRSKELLGAVLERWARAGLETRRVDLDRLEANALLGRAPDADLLEALAWIGSAGVLAVATPVYRATYSGLLKVFFDLLPQDALVGKVGVPIVTGHGVAHSLAVDHGLRPLFASIGATVVAHGIYATSEQFADGTPAAELRAAVDRAVREAVALASAGSD